MSDTNTPEQINYDPSKEPPGIGFVISVSVVVAAFALVFIAAVLSGAIG